MKGACGTSIKPRRGDEKKEGKKEINRGLGFKETAGSRRTPCEECVVTGENPLCRGTAAHAERAPPAVREESWHINVERDSQNKKGRIEAGGGDR